MSNFLPPGRHVRKLSAGGRKRSYVVYVPPTVDSAEPNPVVLAFHGAGTNARTMERFCNLNAKADADGFIVVYPQGSGQLHWFLTFNGGNCCGYAHENQIDDVDYTAALLDDLATITPVDERRIYVTGMSNGAVMAYLLAANLADRIAAIAPVAGPMGTPTCEPSRPVPICHFHGTSDEFAQFEGGVGPKSVSKADFFSVSYTINTWVKANNAAPTPNIELLPPTVRDGTTITQLTHAAQPGGAPVVLYTIHGGGHTWPGVPSLLPELGVTTQNLSANDVMWQFFQQHRLA